MQKVKKPNTIDDNELRFLQVKAIELNVASEAILDCIKNIIKKRSKNQMDDDKTLAEVIKKWEMK